MAIKHLSGETILKYAAGALEPKDATAARRHIKSCAVCEAKIVHVQAKQHRDCQKVQPLLKSYAAHKLTEKDRPFVRGHLVGCGACNDAYVRLVDEHADLRKYRTSDKFNISDLKLPLARKKRAEKSASRSPKIVQNDMHAFQPALSVVYPQTPAGMMKRSRKK